MFARLLARRRQPPSHNPGGAASAESAAMSASAATRDGARAARPGARQTEALVQRLEWTVMRKLDGMLQGDYRTLFRGFGIDFADLREYQPGDDVRHIDWNVTARLQVPHVREYQEDREVAVWFLLDMSGSIDFGSTAQRKRDVLNDFTGIMSLLLTRYGNRTGAVLYNGDDRRPASIVPAQAGRRHMLHLLDRIRATPAAVPGQTRLQDLLQPASAVIRRRSVMFVVSDFLTQPGWQPALAGLARRHEVVAVRLVDPLEVAMPDMGLVVIEDAETGEQLSVDTHDPAFRKRFAALASAREAELQQGFAQAGVDCLTLSTYAPLDLTLLRFARERQHRQRAARKPSWPMP